MNPAIIIPTYWAAQPIQGELAEGMYDYYTPLTKPLPELETCLSSLEQVRGVIRVIVLVVAAPSCATSARARVASICRAHPGINTLIIGDREAEVVRDAISRQTARVDGDPVSLRGYGAIKNLGLAVAAIFGHDSVVFLDDDEVALDENFLIDAVYGLDGLTRQSLRVRAKTGFRQDMWGSPYAKVVNAWSERLWTKGSALNEVLREALLAKTRITRSRFLCGGCCAIHATAYSEVPFDPYITRGEDVDYLLNLRLKGMDVWFDNEWSVRMQPAKDLEAGVALFSQNVYRWVYEARKLEAMNARRELHTLTPESLAPYPGPWVFKGIKLRARRTAFRRALRSRQTADYLRVCFSGVRDADKYARSSSSRYLKFLSVWPTIVGRLWDDAYLRRRLGELGAPGFLGGVRP